MIPLWTGVMLGFRGMLLALSGMDAVRALAEVEGKLPIPNEDVDGAF